ncbi:hypothetical protein BLNAU_18900 [Blattamonas nauphoetae]|uniref:Uncharacterized protein n=1 Tax=Blattamonas nauphoetae TaxID=2049346 RepID=A0ABQ9X316_9EUKA|nr:hypothetical protein BLNAU_18900 [Blattamonas nauphoetae]
MSERPRLGAHGIDLPTSITSDWRLVLQDSITADTLRQGCISLLEQVNSGQNLTPVDVTHAVRFLKYASIHTQYRNYPSNKLMESLLSETVYGQRKLTSALLKLVTHPSNTLQTVALSFLDVNFCVSSWHTSTAMTVTELLSQLFKTLNPLELPLNETTLEFHHQLTYVFDILLINFATEDIHRCLGVRGYVSSAKAIQYQHIDTLITSSLIYLRYLFAAPVCPIDTLSRFVHLSTMPEFDPIMMNPGFRSRYPEIQRFFEELRKDILEELASLLGLPSTDEAELCLYSDWKTPKTAEPWLKGFEYLLGRVSEGTQFTDLGMLAVAFFMTHRPSDLYLFFHSEDKFGLKSSLDTLHSNSTAARRNRSHCIQSVHGSSEHFVNAVDPSKLPFTADFIPFHSHLVQVLDYHLDKILKYEKQSARPWTDQLRGELDETYRAFYTHTKEYVVHLSLHPFALDRFYRDVILAFLVKMNQRDFEDSLAKPYREDARKAMDEVALSSSSPPFILTSQFVCPLTDNEIIDIVDRIVALLESDSCLDDDTILRICAFHKHQLSRIHLPDLFRKAGRSTEQFFHAFECLLSLPIDYLDRAPINHLLSTGCNKQPTFDDWDNVDLRTVGIVKRLFRPNQLSVALDSTNFIKLIVEFIVQRLPQLPHCAARLPQSQLDHLLSPSLDFLCHFFIHPPINPWRESGERMKRFVDVSELCDQRVIVQCLSRTGFFSRFVTVLLNPNYEESEFIFQLITGYHLYPKRKIEDQNAIQRTFPHFLEEGWQDALEFVYVKKAVVTRDPQYASSQMMLFFGANFNSRRG